VSEVSEASEAFEASEVPEESEASEVSEASEASEEAEPKDTITVTVENGMYLKDILSQLGYYQTVDGWLETFDSLYLLISRVCLLTSVPNFEERAFVAEGLIKPGTYTFAKDEDVDTIAVELLSGWDEFFTEELTARAEELGYTPNEILTMASIIEYESSFTEDDSVKADIASVIHNRLNSGTPLQMDVTIFYLQEGIEPYRYAADYEQYYNTYETDSLPAGPINSPSEASVMAALYPNETDYFFFIYDAEGNYYFSADYETHLYYVEQYLN